MRPAANTLLSIYVAAVDGDRLPGDEIAVGGGEEDKRTEQILRVGVAADGPAGDRELAGDCHVRGVFGDHRIAERKARRQRIDPDAVFAELA